MACSNNQFYRGKARTITYSECEFLALVMRYAKGMCHVISSPVVSPAIQHVSTLSHKRHNFRRKITEEKMCFISTTFAWNISNSTKNSATYHKCTQVFMQSTGYSCQILIKLEFPRQNFKKYSNIKSHTFIVAPCIL